MAGQQLARMRAAGADGIADTSVCRVAGHCAAVFRPEALGHCRQERHLCSMGDGQRVRDISQKRSVAIL